MRSPAGLAGNARKRPGGRSSGFFSWTVLITTVAVGLALFYYYLFVGLRNWRESHPESRTGGDASGEAAVRQRWRWRRVVRDVERGSAPRLALPRPARVQLRW